LIAFPNPQCGQPVTTVRSAWQARHTRKEYNLDAAQDAAEDELALNEKRGSLDSLLFFLPSTKAL
jgi:hypothetical protein